MSPPIMTDSPFGTCNYKMSSGITLNVPKIILNSVRTRTVSLYMKYCDEVGFLNSLSERSYMRILESVEPSVRKSMRGLDNFAVDGSQAFDNLKSVVKVLGQIGKGHEWSEKMTGILTEGKQYLKLHYKLHISKNSEIPDHCCNFAMSAGETAYSQSCDHTHLKVCSECNSITLLLDELMETSLNSDVTFEDLDQKDDIQYTVLESVRLIKEWKMHIIRSINQDRARTDILENIKQDEALLERDWAMKFLPLQYSTSLTIWREYEIGKGKTDSYDTVGIDVNWEIPKINVKSVSAITWYTHPMTIQRESPLTSNADIPLQDEIDSTTVTDECGNVFTCPEDGCVATFLRYGYLCNHLDVGRHTYSVEKMDLKEKSRLLYSHLIESRAPGKVSSEVTDAPSGVSALKRGWALKKKREVKRFTQSQKAFMVKNFNEGETTGFKLEPDEVAREMRSVKNDQGKRIFKFEEFLTASQIGSFFCRLYLKKRQVNNIDYEENDLSAEGNTNDLNLISEMAIQTMNQ